MNLNTQPSPTSGGLSLTTSWVGEFQINGGGPWRPVVGTATTTTLAEPLRVETTETSLVP